MPARKTFLAHSPLVVLGGLTLFAPLIDGGTTYFPVLVIRLILLAAVTAWVFFSMKSGGLSLRRSPLFLAIGAFVGWAVLSVLRSPYAAVSLQGLLSILTYAVMLFVVLHLVESAEQIRRLVAVVLIVGLLEAAVGVYQYVLTVPERPTGTFFNANFFAAYEVAVFAVVFGLLCYRRQNDHSKRESFFLWFTAGAVGLAFLLGQSRGALLAFVAAVTFIGLSRFRRIFLGVLALCLLAGALVPTPLQQRVLTIEAKDPYAFTRLDIWKNSLQRIADHPWGVGLGLYKYTSFQYRFPVEGAISRYGKRAESAHNEYLQMATELGIVGLGLFLAAATLFAREVRGVLKGNLEPWERGLVVGLSGGILGFFVHAAVDSVFHEPALVLLMLLFAGLILVLKRLREPEYAPVWVLPFPYAPARVALVGVLTLALTLLIIQSPAAWYAFERGGDEATLGREGAALEWFHRATVIEPGLAAYRDAVALAEVRLYHQSGEVQWVLKAVDELMIGLDLNPLDGRFAHRLGTLHVVLAERAGSGEHRKALLQKAAAFYEQAIRLDPYSPFNYLELGKLRRAEGRLGEAQALFSRATSYEPNFLPARAQLAELSLELGRKEVAAREYAEILRIQERYRGWNLTNVDRQYLEVNSDHLRKSLAMVPVP